MEKISSTIAVTGMNATDNPAPGVAVARSLRLEPGFSGRIIGLGYDPLDPGFYAEGLLDGGAVMPLPSVGRDAFFSHVCQVRNTFGLDVLQPTLDSELRAVTSLTAELREQGIQTFVPTPDALERSTKAHLHKLAEHAGIRVPESEPIMTADALPKAIRRFGLPLMIKGVYYGAHIVHSEADAVHAFHYFVSTWGVPVVVQRYVAGEEYNVAAIGDGNGGLVGAVAMRKMALTDKGKGWSGITVGNPELIEMTEAVISALQWRGPLEVEFMREHESGQLYVIEINPRFPAWIHLSAGAGQNLPYVCALLALGLPVPRPLPSYRVGTMFVRISLDQISDLGRFEQLAATGMLHLPEETR